MGDGLQRRAFSFSCAFTVTQKLDAWVVRNQVHTSLAVALLHAASRPADCAVCAIAGYCSRPYRYEFLVVKQNSIAASENFGLCPCRPLAEPSQTCLCLLIRSHIPSIPPCLKLCGVSHAVTGVAARLGLAHARSLPSSESCSNASHIALSSCHEKGCLWCNWFRCTKHHCIP